MPIVINKALSCVDFFFGRTKDLNNTVKMFVDSDAATNIDHKDYYREFMTQCPNTIEEYIECGSGSKWDSLNLEGAIYTDMGNNNNHGAVTVLIRYRTPFLIDGSPLIIIFGLGEDVSLCTVLGLPVMLLLRKFLDFTTRTLTCSKFNVDFSLCMQQPGVRMPTGAQFDKNRFTATPTITSNILNDNAIFHHVVACTNSLHFNTPTHSDNLVVRDWGGGGGGSEKLFLLIQIPKFQSNFSSYW